MTRHILPHLPCVPHLHVNRPLVVLVQRRQRNIHKSVMHVQSCCFANLNLLLFCRSRCRGCVSCLIYWKKSRLPNFPKMLLTKTICPSRRLIMWGRTALVKEMVPTVFKPRTALSTSSEVFLIKLTCVRPPLLTKISTWKGSKRL